MTDNEARDLALGALRSFPCDTQSVPLGLTEQDAFASAEASADALDSQTALENMNERDAEAQALIYEEAVAGALCGLWACRMHARQLRASAALKDAKATGKRMCQLCKAVEDDGRQGCIETFPPQHRWGNP